MTRRLHRISVALSGALAVALCTAGAAGAAFEPDPGDWTAAPIKGKGAKASVEFFVDGGSVMPTVSYEIRRCKRAGKGWSETVDLAAVPVSGGAFKIRDRHRKGRAKVDLRLAGTFDSELEAHGTLRASVKLRGRRGRRPVTCKLPKLSWTAELVAPTEEEVVGDEEAWVEEDEAYDEGDGDEYDDEYYPEDDESYDEDDEYYDDEVDEGE